MEKYNIPENNSLDSMEGGEALEELTDKQKKDLQKSSFELKESSEKEELYKKAYNEGYKRGEFATLHDYSKDLNALDSQLAYFKRHLSELQEKISSIVTNDSEKNKISELFKEISNPEQWWLLRSRFLMAHNRVKTEGRYYEAPEWCIDMLKEGSRGALYSIIKLLVWHPKTHKDLFVEFSQIVDKLSEEKELDAESLEEFSRIMAYDEKGRYPEIDKKIIEYKKKLFKDNITKDTFSKLHPPPQVNRSQAMSEQILNLSDRKDKKWIPIEILLPNLVFVLRTAFQHAWLRTYMNNIENKDIGESQDIVITTDTDPFKILIDFPFSNPLSNSEKYSVGEKIPLDSLPWGNLSREISHYSGFSNWKVYLTIVPKSEMSDGISPSAIYKDDFHYRINIEL